MFIEHTYTSISDRKCVKYIICGEKFECLRFNYKQGFVNVIPVLKCVLFPVHTNVIHTSMTAFHGTMCIIKKVMLVYLKLVLTRLMYA